MDEFYEPFMPCGYDKRGRTERCCFPRMLHFLGFIKELTEVHNFKRAIITKYLGAE
jgi:hypothetical protein